VNQEFSRLFNVPLAEAFGRTDFDIFPAAIAHAFQQNDRTVLESRTTLKVEEIAPHPDGPHSYLSVKFPLIDAAGEAYAVAGISTDITDRIWLKRTAEELKSATEVQRRLYPGQPPLLAGFDLAGAVSPASHLCGDYYDYVMRPDGTLAICVGDVSGHGLGPALEMVETRAVLRMLLRTEQPLPDVVATLNRLLCDDTPESSFLTLLVVELDPVARRFRYVGAGHDAWLFHRDGRIDRLPSTGSVVALFETAEFPLSDPMALEPGDLLLLCTDGIVEAMSPDRDLFGHSRLCAAVQKHREHSAAVLLAELFSDVRRFAGQVSLRDDMTAVAVKAV
jgi:sigma-B regulation protein RsbU (phosphoserine phosphatase)